MEWFRLSFSRINPCYEKAIEEYWLANDPEEAQRREITQKEAEVKVRTKAADTSSSDDSYISTMAKIYAQEKKENDEYLKRLHEWATGDDDYTPGAGGGI